MLRVVGSAVNNGKLWTSGLLPNILSKNIIMLLALQNVDACFMLEWQLCHHVKIEINKTSLFFAEYAP